MFQKVCEQKDIIQRTKEGACLKTFKLQLAFKNSPNLRRKIVNRDPPESTDGEGAQGFHRCLEKCAFCTDLTNSPVELKTPAIFCHAGGITVPSSTCSTKNLVYLAACITCGAYYIGETAQELKERCQHHRLLPQHVS
jgi:hypothetical protein